MTDQDRQIRAIWIYNWFPWRLQQRILYRISVWCKRRYDKRLAQRIGAIPYQRFTFWDELATTLDKIRYEPVTALAFRVPDSWLSHIDELERIKDALAETPEYDEAQNNWSSANTSLRTASELKASQSKAKTGAEQPNTQRNHPPTQTDLTDILPTDHMED